MSIIVGSVASATCHECITYSFVKSSVLYSPRTVGIHITKTDNFVPTRTNSQCSPQPPLPAARARSADLSPPGGRPSAQTTRAAPTDRPSRRAAAPPRPPAGARASGIRATCPVDRRYSLTSSPRETGQTFRKFHNTLHTTGLAYDKSNRHIINSDEKLNKHIGAKLNHYKYDTNAETGTGQPRSG